MIRLYGYWRSSAAYRVRIALRLKGVAFKETDVSLLDGAQRSPEHLARNPQGFVPALDTGGVMLTQSLAIIEWLDATYPEPRLVPVDAIAAARVRAQALVIAADIHPLDNLRVLKRLKSQFGAEQSAIDDWYRHWIVEGFAALEAMAGQAGDGPFLGGATANLADVLLVPQMYNARRFDVPLDRYPRLLGADAASCALPAFAAAHPDAVKPA